MGAVGLLDLAPNGLITRVLQDTVTRKAEARTVCDMQHPMPYCVHEAKCMMSMGGTVLACCHMPDGDTQT